METNGSYFKGGAGAIHQARKLATLGSFLFIAFVTACGGGGGQGRQENIGAVEASTETQVRDTALQFSGSSEVDASAVAELAKHEEVRKYVAGPHADTPVSAAAKRPNLQSTQGVGETPLPHVTQAPLGAAERLLIKAYLNNPQDSVLVSFLALHSLSRSTLSSGIARSEGEKFKYTLLADYFLSRAKELGRQERWIDTLRSAVRADTERIARRGGAITAEENHPAHVFFNETFNEHEATRYIALDRLLDDFVVQPKNVYTAFLLTSSNTWIGGEAEYDDPTVLHNFVVGAWASIHTMNLAHALEDAWVADHSATPRFRMASILGGFSALNRRWLGKLHGDTVAVAALDDEHRQWRLVQRAFHAFTVGLSFFEESANFAEGMAAWQDSFTHCAEVPVRTCSNLPRFSHNFASFVLGYVDFLLKAGQANAARQFLSIRHDPVSFPPMAAYATWDLGRKSWEEREAHVDERIAAYANGNPDDDPMNFMLRKKRWGADTATCQVCHQAQSTPWTAEEKKVIVLPPEEVASVRQWPKVATTWYGSRLP